MRLRATTALCAAALLVPAATVVPARAGQAAALEPGTAIARDLAGGGAHAYSLAVAANQYVFVVVEQQGIDVVVALAGPDGKPIVEIDSPTGDRGPEPLRFVSTAAGTYRVEVRAFEPVAPAGRYEIKITERREAKPDDRPRVRAEWALMRAAGFGGDNTAAGLRGASAAYEEALPFLREIDDRPRELAALSMVGGIALRFRELRKALDSFLQAEAIQRGSNDPLGLADTLNNVGGAYSELTLWDEAREKFREALQLARHNDGGPRRLGTLLNNLGNVHRQVGEVQTAMQLYEESLQFRDAVKDPVGRATTLNNMCIVYSGRTQRQKALDCLLEAHQLLGKNAGPVLEATALNNIGKVYTDLNEKRTALAYLNRALKLRESTVDLMGQAVTLNNIGTALDGPEEFEEALRYLERALSLQAADPEGEAATLNNIGARYSGRQDHQKALQYHQRALVLRQRIRDQPGEADSLNNIGSALQSLRQFPAARDHYVRALEKWRAAGDRAGEAATLNNLAHLDYDEGRFAQALGGMEATLKIVESLRADIGSLSIRSSYFETAQEYWHSYIDMLMQLHKSRPAEGYSGRALEASDRARARALRDTLAEAGANVRRGVDPQLLERVRILEDQLSARAHQQRLVLNRKHTADEAADAAARLDAAVGELQQIEAAIRTASPGYAALTQPQPLTLKEIQSQLDAETLLLEYHLGGSRSYLWAVTRSSITGHELPPAAAIEADARAFYHLMTTPNQIYAGGDSVVSSTAALRQERRLQTASQLSATILGPVAAQLGRKRLVVVADGVLQYVPFAALPDPVATDRSGRRQPLMIEHEVVNLPSIAALTTMRVDRTQRKPAPLTVAVLADPVFGGRFSQLAGSRKEGEGILALVLASQAASAYGVDASRAFATSGTLGRYRYVHFATHGVVDSVRPELTSLVLSLEDKTGAAIDGFLRMQDVYNLDLPAELVMLSACQTGLGKEVRGEGLVGLTRGFMHAGASRVVVSLWRVDDDATAALVISFYGAMLKQGKRPADALRAAQIEMWKKSGWEAPHYWAPFVLQGEWR